MITAQMVKELRERTGAGMMNCKKALKEADGDTEKAIEILREKGLAAAAKKSGRVASEGLVKTYVSKDGKAASIVEVNCETDFVAVNSDFVSFVDNLAKQVADSKASTVEELLKEKYIVDSSKTVGETLVALIAKLGENMAVRRFKRFSVSKGLIQSYIHGGGRIGVLVKLECDNESDVLEEVAKDVAMQVAATNPLFLDKNSVDDDTLNKEKDIYRVQALNEGKPEKIVEKIIMGKIQKYYKENCLVEQIWVKDSDLTINKYINSKSKEVGAPIKVSDFVRFEKGEGIEKKEEDFAEEVRKQIEGK
ncbi:translation elongation factor Ts [Clostridium luticellarii]|jgi:elongation factor Ts|uniref:Elongation factor Ts n=1 Tax=Clostridium luticellarii TaxID=1691940 RepID=A0A2T0BRD5_9CLOT|nr:translation elongation factor Ts [Clostridium luticellarii]MCI1943902.1 translation elongation factor Ts [Clostridium luticellarii]MCI1967163.1 translation elongation factor Ts [Clostridium luticellarii]MCI1994530.1 translation elongation factor Ts [Clostridium luticellarii]MCI2038517.1 translation elongation factor Ts [Clostridium luticellarii]PRR86392.1 Elongation factor Ts [Clostridium luticellarii]